MAEKECIERGRKQRDDYKNTKILERAYDASYNFLLGREPRDAEKVLRSISEHMGHAKEIRDRTNSLATVVFSSDRSAYRPDWGLLFRHLLLVDEMLLGTIRSLTKKGSKKNELNKYLTERVGLSDFLSSNFVEYVMLSPTALLSAIERAK